MATFTKEASPTNLIYATWSAIANGQSGAYLESAEFSDKTMQIFGTFGAAGSVTLEGSNDPRVITDSGNAVWFALIDPQGSTITKTSAAGEAILENPRFIRPRCTAGDGTTNLTVIICAKKAP